MVVERPLQSPPSYQEAMCSDGGQSSTSETSEVPEVSFSQLSAMLNNLRVDIEQSSTAVVLVSCEKAQVFFIPVDGQVTSPSQRSSVKIFMLEGKSIYERFNVTEMIENTFRLGTNMEDMPRYFLSIEDIYYPLVANSSPCLRTDYGAFLFPDIENRNSSIGVLIPSDHLELFTCVLEDILQKSLRKDTDTAREKGHHISANIIKGATFLSNGLIKGAEKTSNYMNDSAPGLLRYINPSQNDKHVCSKMKNGVKVAKNVTCTAADVTCYVGMIHCILHTRNLLTNNVFNLLLTKCFCFIIKLGK